MTDLIWGLILWVSAALGGIAFLMTWRRRDESESAIWLLLLCASNIGWAVCHALFYVWPTFETAMTFNFLRYFFIMCSGWLMYLFIIQTLKHHMFDWRTLVCIFALPVIDIIVILLNPSDVFVSYERHFVAEAGMRGIVFSYGPWYWVHCLFSYMPLVSASYIIIKQFIRLPLRYKLLVGSLLLGTIIVFLMTLLRIFDYMPYPIDLAPVFVLGTQLVLYYTLFNSHSLDMLFASRDIIFERSNSALLILDTNGMIMDYNQRAAHMAKSLNIESLFNKDSQQFIQEWKNTSSGHDFEEDQTIFSVLEEGIDAHYQVQVSALEQKNGRVWGSYMEIKNITPMMSLIHMLQDAAHFDHLTRLPNRNYFHAKLGAMDQEVSLPLCVMVGDVNRLKAINDNYGHVKGDQLLKRISEILLRCAPNDMLLTRMGGDEFVGLIPNASEEMAQTFILDVEAQCAKIDDIELKGASIALGYKIKTSMDQDILELMHLADMEMYSKKRDRRLKNS